MSFFHAGAPQIWAMEPRAQRSQFRAGMTACLFRFVSSGSLAAKRRDALARRFRAITRRSGKSVQGRRPPCGRLCAGLLLCTAFVAGAARAEPSAETIARGKALTEAGGCASCHTADPAKPFAGGKRIDTPFGGIYSPNLTPDRDTGIGAWSDDEFLAGVALRRGAATARAIIRRSPTQFHRTDPRRHSGDPRLSRDADAGPQHSRRRRNCAGR